MAILVAGLAATAALAAPTSALAVNPPQIGAIWVTKVNAASATLSGELNPEGSLTSYRFEYITDTAYQENVATSKEPFTGAAKAPAGGSASAGSGTSTETVSKAISALRSGTKYHYRLTATNAGGPTISPERWFVTQNISVPPEECGNKQFREQAVSLSLPDCRVYELVSPPDKNGGAIQGFEELHGGGTLQAGATGAGAITYSSASSFGGGEALGAPPASQYISRRLPGAEGWITENITAPTVSGSYGANPDGVPYELFSPDLARSLMLNGVRCRGEGTECPVANPPLPASGAPTGYQDYYLRESASGQFTALVTASDSPSLTLTPAQFTVAVVGASPDLQRVIISTCAALVPGATEVSAPGGCDQSKQNLYLFSGGQLTHINSSPGAAMPNWNGSVSVDGSRIYFVEGSHLYLHDSSGPHLLGEEAAFQMATPDGSAAFFIESGHLYRYLAVTHAASDLTPSGGVQGMLGASDDGAYVYFQDGGALRLWHLGTTSTVAAGPTAADESSFLTGPGEPSNWGAARTTSGGTRLLFLSKSSEALSGYDNVDQGTGLHDSEVYLYDAEGPSLTCVSCNPTNERPVGPSTIPGSISNGSLPGAPAAYKPRVLTDNGSRVFFNSNDAISSLDANNASDVYQWEAEGAGGCNEPAGCLELISSGNDGEGASFVDASETGDDSYFLTGRSLVGIDPGSRDVYDARVNGGVSEHVRRDPCRGDSCAPPPVRPEDPTVGTLLPGIGNPPVHFPKKECPKGKRAVVRKGISRCVARHHHKKHKGRHGK